MEHRHIDLPGNQWNREAVESVLERGTDAEMQAFLKAVKADPWGAPGELALEVSTETYYYGWSNALPRMVNKWREGQVKK